MQIYQNTGRKHESSSQIFTFYVAAEVQNKHGSFSGVAKYYGCYMILYCHTGGGYEPHTRE